jgi:hypothetical protein
VAKARTRTRTLPEQIMRKSAVWGGRQSHVHVGHDVIFFLDAIEAAIYLSGVNGLTASVCLLKSRRFFDAAVAPSVRVPASGGRAGWGAVGRTPVDAATSAKDPQP